MAIFFNQSQKYPIYTIYTDFPYISRFLESEREKERERERERERNPRAIKRSYGELGQFLDWPEPVQERRNERKRSPIIHEAMSSALSVIVHIFVASALSLTGMADVQLSPYEPPKSQFRLFVKAIEFGRCCSNSSSRSPRFRDTDTRVHTTSRLSRILVFLCLETRGSEPEDEFKPARERSIICFNAILISLKFNHTVAR